MDAVISRGRCAFARLTEHGIDTLGVLTTAGVRKGHRVYQTQLRVGNINLVRYHDTIV